MASRLRQTYHERVIPNLIKDQGYANGLIKLGRIDSGIEALNAPRSLKLTIDRAPGDRK